MSSFFAELKRRNVFKVGIAYAIVAWLLVQVIVSVETPLHLPDWADSFTIILLAIGFPVALILAWAYELMPGGIKPTKTLPEENIQQANQEMEPKETITPAENTLAVLPFTNLTNDPEQEYFADGLTEELLNKLSQVKDLQVTGRTSSFYFKGRNEDLRTIGEMLGVASLLEGSVRKAGDQLRITAQLIKAKDGYHLWSQNYDRPLKDIFAVQDEIAGAVTTALSITLGAGAFRRTGMTRNIEAYDKYLQGISNVYKLTPDSLLMANDQLRQAVDLDPNFGLGWLGLRLFYQAGIIYLSPDQSVHFQEKMTDAVTQARAVAPEMPELLLIAAEEYQINGNWLAAESAFQQLLDERGHTDAGINREYGLMLACTGRSKDAVLYLQRAKRLDPLDIMISTYLSIALLNSSRVNEAVAEIRRVRTFGVVEILAALQANDRQRAAAFITEYYKLNGNQPNATMLKLAEVLVMENNDAALDELKSIAKDSNLPNITRNWLAHIASSLGKTEFALACLLDPRARETGMLDFVFWHPVHRPLRKLPAFKTFLYDRGLVDYWRTTGHWADLCHPVGDDDFECE